MVTKSTTITHSLYQLSYMITLIHTPTRIKMNQGHNARFRNDSKLKEVVIHDALNKKDSFRNQYLAYINLSFASWMVFNFGFLYKSVFKTMQF